ncbi:MAG: hypothetical protein LBQ69_00065 [Treponema sp.]|jgi:hypothetical protein|nr:hypothetical protein [Treponema sp.]
MSDVTDSVNRILQNSQKVETSSFYKDYQAFSKLYNSLIEKGIAQRRESQLKTIQDRGNVSSFSYYNRHANQETIGIVFDTLKLKK